jgi:hypothetical protein
MSRVLTVPAGTPSATATSATLISSRWKSATAARWPAGIATDRGAQPVDVGGGHGFCRRRLGLASYRLRQARRLRLADLPGAAPRDNAVGPGRKGSGIMKPASPLRISVQASCTASLAPSRLPRRRQAWATNLPCQRRTKSQRPWRRRAGQDATR